MLQLERLSASACSLRDLPSTFRHLLNLTVRRGVLSPLLTFELQDVDLSANLMVEFPLELIELPELRRLNLCGNSISLLPRRVRELQRLRHLDLSRSLMCRLPVSVMT